MGSFTPETVSRNQDMRKIRIAARIDVKNEHVIKGIHLEGLRKVGNPNELAKKYYDAGIDEIIFMDAVAAYYDRNSLSHIIKDACRDIFVPITVGGGIRTIADIQQALNSGADKVAINTKAIEYPEFITEASKVYGSQCIVVSIDAKSTSVTEHKWQAYTDNGREPSGLDVIDWSRRVEELGAGELLLTSIDAEGTKRGFDVALNEAVSNNVSIPLISSGGAGSVEHIKELVTAANIDAVALASVFHYNSIKIGSLKRELATDKIMVRL